MQTPYFNFRSFVREIQEGLYKKANSSSTSRWGYTTGPTGRKPSKSFSIHVDPDYNEIAMLTDEGWEELPMGAILSSDDKLYVWNYSEGTYRDAVKTLPQSNSSNWIGLIITYVKKSSTIIVDIAVEEMTDLGLDLSQTTPQEMYNTVSKSRAIKKLGNVVQGTLKIRMPK